MFAEDKAGLGEIENFITIQPPIGQKDDYDSENSRSLHQQENVLDYTHLDEVSITLNFENVETHGHPPKVI